MNEISDEQEKISEEPEFRNEEMIKTALLRLPTPPAAPPPPPPPPPPPSEIQVKPKNGSSSGGAKWTLRTETRNGSDKNSMMTRAEGTVEIPKPQSVASLREQIARKLEVKMLSAQPAPNGASMAIGSSRTRPPLWISSLNGQYPCVPQHSNASSFQHLAPKMSKPSSNSQSSNHTTLQKQISIVHEPMERHVSCITPVPFNRAATLSSVIIAPNTSNISSNNTTVAPTSSDIFLPPPVIHGENNDYKCFSANGKAASSQLSSYQKVNLVKEGAENGVQSSLPLTTPVANGTINLHRSSVSENTASDPPVLNPPSFFVNAHRTVRNETAIKDLEISASANHDDAVPSSNLSAADTVQELGSQFGASSSSIVTTSRSQREMLPLSKPVELRTEIQPEMLPLSKPVELRTEIQRETDHLHQLKSEQQNLTTTAMLKTYNNRQCTQEGKPQGTSATVPRNDTHTENSSWYRTMFKKMHVVDQLDPPVLRYQRRRKLSTPASTVQRINRCWTPNPQLDDHTNSLKSDDFQWRRSKSVGRYVESPNELERSSEFINRTAEEWKLGWHDELDGPNVNGQSLGDVAKAQKLAKHEVLIRQKVEKLSEELLQQRNRRHGYVPSASPALQKNFDRFNGLINEFGRPKRTTTPQPISQPEVTSCTALFSFKAINPKELSFNRGDVIRMCRIVDMNWMEGEHNGQIGIFPSSYVQIDNNEGSEQKKLIALYPFSARNKNELSLKKGETLRHLRNIDANWIEGKNVHGQTGIFPKSYVNEACEVNLHNKHETLIPDRPKIPRITTTPFSDTNPTVTVRTNQKTEVEGWHRRHSQRDFSGLIPKNAENYRVLYAYKPRNVDELELQENDIVFVIEKCDDGWFIGTLPRTGQFGTFPGNYVERN